jgi:hypothetical protein
MSFEISSMYVGVLISLWLFLFAAQPKEFFLDGLKKLQQRSHKFVWSLRGNMEIHFSNPVACFLYKAKDLSPPPPRIVTWCGSGVSELGNAQASVENPG